MLALFAVVLGAAPALPKAAFVEPKKFPAPFTVGKDGARLDKKTNAELLAALVPGRPQLKTLAAHWKGTVAQTAEALKSEAPEVPAPGFMALGRVTVGSCTEWLGVWNVSYLDATSLTLVAFTTGVDGAIVEARELDSSGGGLGAGVWELQLKLEVSGTLHLTQDYTYFVEAMPEDLFGGHELRRRWHFDHSLGADCRLGAPSLRVPERLTGHLLDYKTDESIWIDDDGLVVRVYYSAKGSKDWQALVVDDTDRAPGRLSVHFRAKPKEIYRLAWDAAHATLTSVGPDGKHQVFEDEVFGPPH